MKPRMTLELMMSIIRSGKEHCVTETCRREVLEECGVDLSDFMEITADLPPVKPEGDEPCILGCITYEPGEELVLPDNETCLCGWNCGRTVQHRPNMPAWLTKVCLHCIDERPKDIN